MSTVTHNHTSEDLTISGLLLILKRRRLVLFGTTLLLFTCAVLVCIFMTRRYEAQGKIQVAKQGSDGLGLEDMMGGASGASDALDANITLQTQADILKSDTLALQVIEKLKLQDTPDFKARFSPTGWLLGLMSPKGPKDPAHASLEDSPSRRSSVLRTFHSHLKVETVAGTRLIQISYTSSDPKIAAAVVNDLAKGIVDYNFQTRYNATNEASQWLSGQLDDLKKQATEHQAKVEQLQREAGVYSLGSADSTGKEMAYSATLDRLEQSTNALSQATSERIVKGGVYELVKSGNPDLISGLAGNSLSGGSTAVNNAFNLLQNLRSQQAALETQLAADRSKYGSANPKLKDEEASLQSINAAVHSEVERIGDRAQNDYRAAKIAEAKLRSVYDQNRAAADRLNDKAIEYSIAKEEATDSRNLYENLFQRLKEAGVIEGLHSSNITVVDPGRVPAKPIKPNVPVYLAISIMGGLFLGTVGALVIDTIDDRIQSAEMVEGSLNTPLLAVLPAFGQGNKWLGSYRTAAAHAKPTTNAESDPAGNNIIALNSPNAAFSEALRGLRTSILLSRSIAPPKIILVTSAAEGEGKSTVCMNLATTLVRNNSRVLLVDGDMRRPVLAKRFMVQPPKGLSNLLAGDEGAFQLEPLPSLPGLSVMPSGPVAPYPSELLGSARMRELLNQWSTEYDFVLLDSPPILAVTDASILSTMADTTLLITRHGQSTRKSLERAYGILANDRAGQIGVVLNGVNLDSAAYGEYYGYHGKSYYTKETVDA
jgi:polysaccharide biosynthesis transport protein